MRNQLWSHRGQALRLHRMKKAATGSTVTKNSVSMNFSGNCGKAASAIRSGWKSGRLQRQVRRLVDHDRSGDKVVESTPLAIGQQHQELAPYPGILSMLQGLKPPRTSHPEAFAPVEPRERLVLRIGHV